MFTQDTKKLLYIFFLAVFIRGVYLYLGGYVHVLPDASLFYEMARAIGSGTLNLFYAKWHSVTFPLYPLVLAPLIKLGIGIQQIVWVNVILSSLAVIPAYYLSKRIKDPVISILFILIVVLNPTLNYTATVMSENLLIPIFLTTFYFMDRWYRDENIFHLKNLLLFEVFAVLTILTKITGLIFILVFAVLLLYKLYLGKIHHIPSRPKVRIWSALAVVIALLIVGGLIYMYKYPTHLLPITLDPLYFVNNLFYLIFGSFMIFWFVFLDRKGAFGLAGMSEHIPGIVLIVLVFLGVSLQGSHARYLDPVLMVVFYIGMLRLSEMKKIEAGAGKKILNALKDRKFLVTISTIVLISLIVWWFHSYEDYFHFYISNIVLTSLKMEYQAVFVAVSFILLYAFFIKRYYDILLILILTINLFFGLMLFMASERMQEDTVCWKIVRLIDKDYSTSFVYFVSNKSVSYKCALLTANLLGPERINYDQPCDLSGVCIYASNETGFWKEYYDPYEKESLYVLPPVGKLT